MAKISKLDPKLLKQMYYNLTKIRKFEEKIVELYPKQEMRCPVHLYIGQEAIAAGVCANLAKSDYVFSTHRNHGHLIAKGADIKLMFAELYGKRTGCSSGKGGSMHMISPENGIFGTSAIVAGGLPLAVGAGLAAKMKKEKRVSVVFFGDGAVDEGTFYESLNFAALKKLPVIFVCENNFYATNSPQKARQANTYIYQIAEFFRVPGFCVEGNDIFEVHSAAREAVRNARAGGGPSLIEARTYRWKSHVGPETDIEKGFRDKKEVEEWLAKCPHNSFREYLLKNKLLKKGEIAGIEKKVDSEISAALEFAWKSPYPVSADLNKDVY